MSTARTYLQADFERLFGQRKRTAILSVVLIVFAFGYLTWLLSAVRDLTKPDNLAATASGFIQASLPDAEKSVSGVIAVQAPQVARFMGNTVVTQLPPVLRSALEEMVLQYTRDIAEVAVTHLDSAYRELLVGIRTDLAAVAQNKSEQDQAERLAGAMTRALERAAKGEVKGDPFDESLMTKLEKSGRALASLNDRLAQVLTPGKGPETRRGKLERRFITTFWRFMQQDNPDLNAKPDGLGAKPTR